MTYIFPISDVHIGMREEFYEEKNIRRALGFLEEYGKDIIMCCCGDIGDRYTGILWITKVLECFPELRVVYTPGNHEFYGTNIDVLQYDLWKAGHQIDRLYVLDGQYVFKHEIDGISFIGATLWTDFNKNAPAVKNIVQRDMNDYRTIFSGGSYKLITTDRIFNEHCEQRKAIYKKLNNLTTEKCVVMSHHSPIPTHEGHAGDMLTYGYCSDLSFMLEEAQHVPQYWLSGHTHSSVVRHREFPNGETMFVSNQMGYPTEFNTGYTDACILEV